METIKLIGRGSRLSLLQMEKAAKKIESAFPLIKVDTLIRNSRGDALQNIPLHTAEGSDFFTQDIFDALKNGEADIAVHSLKDMSSAHFFGKNQFAVIDRDDVRDVAIFRNDIEEKLQQGKSIIIGTCSPRREEMATVFLQKALPQLGSFTIETKSIRGNVDTRLKKLEAGEYDGIILATAGLNRLLENEKDGQAIYYLLKNRKLMLLPLIECVPAPCQGAIVAEANHSNKKAIEILNRINIEEINTDCIAEKKEAMKYGSGCIQKFGVTTISTNNGTWVYSAGTDSNGNHFVNWHTLPEIKIDADNLFSAPDYMKDFFTYEWKEDLSSIEQPVVFIANYKAIRPGSEKELLKQKTLIASGTRTWHELAKQGFWVTASADGLGFEFLLPSLQMPLLNIKPGDVCIITHEEAAERWKQKKYHAVSNYKLIPKYTEEVAGKISSSGYIFWSSFSQYQYYRQYVKPDATHLCPAGETASLLKQQGIDPIIFPTIKAFEQWKKTSIRSRSVA
jgi:hydroxymethylbilane synthase